MLCKLALPAVVEHLRMLDAPLDAGPMLWVVELKRAGVALGEMLPK